MLEEAIALAREAVENLYDATCTVIEHDQRKDPVSKETESVEIEVYHNKACKLSYSTVKNSNQTDAANSVSQVVKIFIAPELIIKPGSKLVITSKGRTTEYKNSGVPAVYNTHQEIVLELFNGWA